MLYELDFTNPLKKSQISERINDFRREQENYRYARYVSHYLPIAVSNDLIEKRGPDGYVITQRGKEFLDILSKDINCSVYKWSEEGLKSFVSKMEDMKYAIS